MDTALPRPVSTGSEAMIGLVDLSDGSLVGKVLAVSIGPVDEFSTFIEGTVRFAVVQGKQEFLAKRLGLVNQQNK